HGGRTIARVLRGGRPERFLRNPPTPPLGHGHLQRFAVAGPDREEAFDRPVAADTTDLLGDDRPVLPPVTTGVDHGMTEWGVNLLRREMTDGAHGTPPGSVLTRNQGLTWCQEW